MRVMLAANLVLDFATGNCRRINNKHEGRGEGGATRAAGVRHSGLRVANKGHGGDTRYHGQVWPITHNQTAIDLQLYTP